MKNLIIVLPLFSLVIGCAQSNLNIQSTPDGAEVFLIKQGQQPISIGKTPLNVPSQRIAAQGGSSVQVRVVKDGFQPESFLAPNIMFDSSIDFSVKLKEQRLPLVCTQQTNAVEKVANFVAKAQFHIQKGEYSEAERLLLTLSDENPDSKVIYDLLGNVNYLSKNLEQALKYYEKSLKLDSASPETKRMVQKLRSITGARFPAGSDQ